MLFSRILGAVGRIMIASGVLILMFVVYQLWGTGLRTSAAQDRLGEQFAAKKARIAETTGTSSTVSPTLPGEGPASSLPTGPPTTATAPTPPTTAPTPPTTGATGPATAAFPPPKPGDAIGEIAIPKIGADFTMVEGVDLSFLSEGPGHFPGTPFPGQEGNAALAGHRTTWLAPFNRIDELAPGDQITVTTLQGSFTYTVLPQPGATPTEQVGYKIVGPNSTEILDQTPGQNTLTLMACHPKYSAAQRIVVVAKMDNAPAATTEKSEESKAAASTPDVNALVGGSGGDLVSNHPEDRLPALLWGLVAGVVWFLAWLLARRWPSYKQWQRWAVFAVAFPVFIVPLFLCFEHINHLLPAGY